MRCVKFHFDWGKNIHSTSNSSPLHQITPFSAATKWFIKYSEKSIQLRDIVSKIYVLCLSQHLLITFFLGKHCVSRASTSLIISWFQLTLLVHCSKNYLLKEYRKESFQFIIKVTRTYEKLLLFSEIYAKLLRGTVRYGKYGFLLGFSSCPGIDDYERGDFTCVERL